MDEYIYLNKNAIRLRDSLEQVIRGPTNSNKAMAELIGRHIISKLDDTPGEHCGGEGHRKTELDVVSSIIVAAGEVKIEMPAITEP